MSTTETVETETSNHRRVRADLAVGVGLLGLMVVARLVGAVLSGA